MDLEKIRKQQVIFCPHCGNKTVQEIKSIVEGSETLQSTSDFDSIEVETYAFTIQCATCGEVSLLSNWDGADEPFNLSEAVILYPYQKEFNKTIPKAILESYNESKKVQNVSPQAFALIARATVELICEEQKASGKDLFHKLSDLAKKNIIPDVLSRMANALRVFGNVAAHEDSIKIEAGEAKILHDFLSTLIEYVYIAPNKVDNLAEQLKKKALKK